MNVVLGTDGSKVNFIISKRVKLKAKLYKQNGLEKNILEEDRTCKKLNEANNVLHIKQTTVTINRTELHTLKECLYFSLTRRNFMSMIRLNKRFNFPSFPMTLEGIVCFVYHTGLETACASKGSIF